MKKENLVLIGFRGCGKTTFGREMAKILDLPFADIDEEIEFLFGEKIEKFVEKNGWQEFRAVEQRVSHDFTRHFSGIVATGGGTILNSKNLQNLKKTGNFLFLNPNFSDVKKFLMSDKSRPRLMPDVPLTAEIDQIWAQRKGIYSASADIEASPKLLGDPKKEAEKILEEIPDEMIPAPLKKKRVAVLSSSRGTTLDGIFAAQKRGRIPNAEFCLFLTDQKNCGALKIAEKKFENIKILDPENSENFNAELLNFLREENPDAILLAGWMRILPPEFCEQFGNITVNAHPSLLPKFAGLRDIAVHEKVLDHDEKWTGCTLHKTSKKIDAGETILQRKILVDKNDTPDSLKLRVQKQEMLGFCEFLERW